MKDINEQNIIDKEYDQKLFEKIEQTNKIIQCLNEFEEIVERDPSYRNPLKISEQYINTAYEQILLKIRYIKEALIDENSFEELYLNVFEVLFIDSSRINYDKLESKISLFKIALNSLKAQPEKDKENEFIQKVKEEKKEWNHMIELLSAKYGGFVFIFCLFLIYSKSKEQVVEFFISFMKTLYTCSVEFKLNEIKDISEAVIAEDLCNFIEDTTNYFYIIIEDEHIKKYKFSDLETKKAINDEFDLDSHEKKKQPKMKKLGEKENKTIMVKSVESENNKNVYMNNEIKENEFEGDGKIKEKKVNEDKKINEQQPENSMNINEKQMNNLLEDLKNVKIELKQLKSKQLIMENHQYTTQKKLAEIKPDLLLIQSKEVLKSFIDLFHRGLGLKDSDLESYETKVSNILFELNKIGDYKKYEQIKINKIKELLRESIKKLKIGNSNEFGMDLTKPILEQLFKILDPFEKSKDIQESLNKIGVDKILINSIKAKQELSYNKKELETEEVEINKNLNFEVICSIFEKRD